MVEAYPLYWPDNWKRTPYQRRKNGKFKQTFGGARDLLMTELKRLGAGQIVLSTNIPVRNDGLPYASARHPEDPGVAVYFYYNKRQMCFACDQYEMIKDNTQAIKLTVEALRGIERWGASDMIDRAFQGFAALPPASRPWREVLECVGMNNLTLDYIDSQFKRLARKHHPDMGGTDAAMTELNQAREQAENEVSRAVR
jgi:hypothetical protein